MKDFFISGLRIPADLSSMINSECERQEAISGSWPGVYPVIVEALYEHFNAVQRSYQEDDKK